jgi:hypothetical protein
VFVDTQIWSEAGGAPAEMPLWRYFPRDTLDGDFTNKWAPNMTGLRAMLEDCQLQPEDAVVVQDRGWVRARSFSNVHLEYFRKLDVGARMWGAGGRPRD